MVLSLESIESAIESLKNLEFNPPTDVNFDFKEDPIPVMEDVEFEPRTDISLEFDMDLIPIKEQPKLLISSEALAIAHSRGFKGSKNAFRVWMKRHPDEGKSKYGIQRIPERDPRSGWQAPSYLQFW